MNGPVVTADGVEIVRGNKVFLARDGWDGDECIVMVVHRHAQRGFVSIRRTESTSGYHTQVYAPKMLYSTRLGANSARLFELKGEIERLERMMLD